MPDNAQDANTDHQSASSLQAAPPVPETSSTPLKRKRGRPKRVLDANVTEKIQNIQLSRNVKNKPIDINEIIEYRVQGLSFADIGKLYDVNRSTVFQRLKPYYEDIEDLNTYKHNEDNILAMVRKRLAFSIDNEAIKKMQPYQRGILLCALLDKSKASMTTTNVFNTVIQHVHAQGLFTKDKDSVDSVDSVDNTPNMLISNDK